MLIINSDFLQMTDKCSSIKNHKIWWLFLGRILSLKWLKKCFTCIQEKLQSTKVFLYFIKCLLTVFKALEGDISIKIKGSGIYKLWWTQDWSFWEPHVDRHVAVPQRQHPLSEQPRFRGRLTNGRKTASKSGLVNSIKGLRKIYREWNAALFIMKGFSCIISDLHGSSTRALISVKSWNRSQIFVILTRSSSTSAKTEFRDWFRIIWDGCIAIFQQRNKRRYFSSPWGLYLLTRYD